MRLDKYLSNLGLASRKDIIKYIKYEHVLVNDEIITKKDYKLEFGDMINIGDDTFEYLEYIYLILHKPKNYISSKIDEAGYSSVYDLLDDCIYANLLHIVGRLDSDTSGLLLFTNDGKLTHSITHPKKEIYKKYRVHLRDEIQGGAIEKLESGVKIDDYISKPARVEMINSKNIYLYISEGKYHQVKKMILRIGNEVLDLHREAIGGLEIGDLKLSEWRYVGESDLDLIFK